MKNIVIAVLVMLGCYASLNAQTWQNFQVVPWNENGFINAVSFVNANTGCVGLYGIYRTTDAGQTWANVETSLVTRDIKFYGQTGYAVGASGTGRIYKTTDAGATWTEIWGFPYGSDFAKIGLVNENVLYVTTPSVGNGYKTLHLTTDGGITWDSIFSAYQPYLVGGTRINGITYAVSQGNIYVNIGEDWFLHSMGITCHSDLVSNNGVLYEGGQENLNGAITRSTDGGTTWISSILNTSDQAICFELAFRNSIGYAGGSQFDNNSTTGKVWTCTDGINWSEIYSQPTKEFTDLCITERYVYFVGRGGNIFRYDPTLTGIENEHGSLPNEFRLNQNYPNPFNPSTTIGYSIPKKSHVKISVYDMTGKEITRVVDATKEAGSHKVQFNAGNLASGVYFYRIIADNYSAVKKMSFVK